MYTAERVHGNTTLDQYMDVLARNRSVPTLASLGRKSVSKCTRTTMEDGGMMAKRRFDQSLDHTTVVVKQQKTQCALHRFVGLRREGILSYCVGCNVYLCSVCYHVFHKEKDPQKINAEFIRNLENASDDRLGECKIISDDCLLENGDMNRRRLDQSLDHIPMNAGKKRACAMHRWLGFDKRKEGRGKTGATLLYCPGCELTLCRTCYNDFHKIPDLVRIKYWLQQECLERQDKPNDGFWLRMERRDYADKSIQNGGVWAELERLTKVQEQKKKRIQNILSSV